MSRAELKKAFVIDKLIHHQLTTAQVSYVLGLSTRQVLRLKAKVQQEGSEALAHGNQGRAPAHIIAKEVRQQIIRVYTETYQGANRCHFADELLAEHEAIQVSPSTVGRLLTHAGIAPTRQRRRSNIHRPRDRKPQPGMLWQTDASNPCLAGGSWPQDGLTRCD